MGLGDGEDNNNPVLSLRQQCINFIVRANIRFDFSSPPSPPEGERAPSPSRSTSEPELSHSANWLRTRPTLRNSGALSPVTCDGFSRGEGRNNKENEGTRTGSPRETDAQGDQELIDREPSQDGTLEQGKEQGGTEETKETEETFREKERRVRILSSKGKREIELEQDIKELLSIAKQVEREMLEAEAEEIIRRANFLDSLPNDLDEEKEQEKDTVQYHEKGQEKEREIEEGGEEEVEIRFAKVLGNEEVGGRKHAPAIQVGKEQHQPQPKQPVRVIMSSAKNRRAGMRLGDSGEDKRKNGGWFSIVERRKNTPKKADRPRAHRSVTQPQHIKLNNSGSNDNKGESPSPPNKRGPGSTSPISYNITKQVNMRSGGVNELLAGHDNTWPTSGGNDALPAGYWTMVKPSKRPRATVVRRLSQESLSLSASSPQLPPPPARVSLPSLTMRERLATSAAHTNAPTLTEKQLLLTSLPALRAARGTHAHTLRPSGFGVLPPQCAVQHCEPQEPPPEGCVQLPRSLIRELNDAVATAQRHRVVGVGGVSFKVVLLGSEAAGKTSLSASWRNNNFPCDSGPTIAVEFWQQRLVVDGTYVSIELWDTAGQQRFDSLAPMYYKGADAAIILYDATSPFSWLKAMFWVGEVQQKAPNVIIFLVATKVEVPLVKGVSPCVGYTFAKRYSKEHGIDKWVAVSAKKNYNVNHLFVTLARVLLRNKGTAKPIIRRRKTKQPAPKKKKRLNYNKHTQDIGGCKAWQPNSGATNCNSCKKPFTIVLRRHHCRKCGKLFCQPCTKRKTNIPSHPVYRTKLVRVCYTCYRDLQQYPTL